MIIVASLLIGCLQDKSSERSLFEKIGAEQSREFYYGGGKYGLFRDELIQFVKSDSKSNGYSSLRILKKYILQGEVLISQGATEQDINLSCFQIEGHLLRNRVKNLESERIWKQLSKARAPYQLMIDKFMTGKNDPFPKNFAGWKPSVLEILNKSLK